jgi:hypothetical protein
MNDKMQYDPPQIRAEKTMFALLHERNWDAKSDR